MGMGRAGKLRLGKKGLLVRACAPEQGPARGGWCSLFQTLIS